MGWDGITAVAAVAQTAVVAAAGVIALVQIRHLAAQNSLSFLMRMLDVYNSEEFNRSRQYVFD
jgi:predicted amino acid dehydrogenase